MKKLSRRQQEIYDFLKAYLEDNSYPPTQSEIADALGISQTAARNHLIALSKKEFIKLTESIPRSIVIKK